MKIKCFLAFLFTLNFVGNTNAALSPKPILAFPNKGYKIDVKINGFKEKQLYLGYYLGDKTYVKDTAELKNGIYSFQGDEQLEAGLYTIVLPPDNKNFQIIINATEQFFSIVTNEGNPDDVISIKGATDCQLFYKYLGFIKIKRQVSADLNYELKLSTTTPEKQKLISSKLEALDKEVTSYQDNLIGKNPQTVTALLLKSTREITIPKAIKDDQEKAYWYYRNHYFDNIDFSDTRLLRTPEFYGKVDKYFENLIPNHPDSINNAVDFILQKVKTSPAQFQFWASSFLNKYAKSIIVGMDAVYVHIANTYYSKEQTPWIEEKKLLKIITSANKLAPLLIGKTAPDISMLTLTGEKIKLHDVKAKYLLLYFWDIECSLCTQSTPNIKKFYEAYKDKGLQIFSAFSKQELGIGRYTQYIENMQIGDWIHTYSENQSYKIPYDLTTTPQIYILDANKKILFKKIGADQLNEVMDRILKKEN